MKKGVGSTAFLLSCCRELGFPNKNCIALVTAQHTHIVPSPNQPSKKAI